MHLERRSSVPRAPSASGPWTDEGREKPPGGVRTEVDPDIPSGFRSTEGSVGAIRPNPSLRRFVDDADGRGFGQAEANPVSDNAENNVDPGPGVNGLPVS